MEKKLKIAICDDEKIIAEDIERRIHRIYEKMGVEHSIAVMKNPSSLLLSERTSFNVLFLDVDMGEWNGIDVAESLRKYDSSLIIVYISSHIEYSPLGYNVKAFRYLLKNGLDDTLNACLEAVYNEYRSRPEYLTIKCGADSVEIKLDEILYIESQKPVRLIYVINYKEPLYKSYETMQDIEEHLPPKAFLRVQRSFIVNLAHVTEIKNYQAIIENGVVIQTSRKDYSELRRKFLLWKGR